MRRGIQGAQGQGKPFVPLSARPQRAGSALYCADLRMNQLHHRGWHSCHHQQEASRELQRGPHSFAHSLLLSSPARGSELGRLEAEAGGWGLGTRTLTSPYSEQ